MFHACSKDTNRHEENNGNFKTSDTCLVKVAYIDPNGIVTLSVTDSIIVNAFESALDQYYKTQNSNYIFNIDSLQFKPFYNQADDTVNIKLRQYYLTLYGVVSLNAKDVLSVHSAIELIRIGDDLYVNKCSDGDGPGIVIKHSCESVLPCTGCGFTYAWSFWFFNGKITGCVCTSGEGVCTHKVERTVSISLL
ncbi:MAG: hypothetical protein Q7J34_00705 [Bacteroidales bacterium]|nr:hypothetical protein [Bacteroidales bacterium]